VQITFPGDAGEHGFVWVGAGKAGMGSVCTLGPTYTPGSKNHQGACLSGLLLLWVPSVSISPGLRLIYVVIGTGV
jgi:hypothetical protein